MDKSYITFDVRSTSSDKSLGLEILLNNTVVYDNNSFITAESLQVEIPDEDGEYVLKIILKNKTAEHTVLDTLGAIVQDANLIIDNFKFDDIVVGFTILQLATYVHDCNGTEELKEYKFYGEMGCNGTVELKFTTPIYLWLLENM